MHASSIEAEGSDEEIVSRWDVLVRQNGMIRSTLDMMFSFSRMSA